MNTKLLATLGVVVALVTAWLFVALYTASTVSIEPTGDAGTSVEPVSRSSAPAKSLGNGSGGAVETSVFVSGGPVQTSVTIAE